jgi:membrane-associated phospholipid phosphatase
MGEMPIHPTDVIAAVMLAWVVVILWIYFR